MTAPREKEVKKEEKIPEENLSFDNSEEIVLAEQEIKNLVEKLEVIEIDDKTRSFFKSAHQFSKKLERNENVISLEEIEKL